MDPGNLLPCSVTPAGQLLARCVAKGLLRQEDIDAIPRDGQLFPLLQETQQHMAKQKRLDEVNLELELLKLEKDAADVTHDFYLSQRVVSLQQFTSHLQGVLREQAGLRQRLMKPLCQTSLPLEADLHSYVVDVIKMVVDFIQNLEKNISTVRTIPTVDDSMNKLNNSMVQLLAQVAEVEKLSKLVLQWRNQNSSSFIDSSKSI